jgi:site-specific recombinase XerD
MRGVDLLTVGELLGHRTFQMTMRYAHLAADHKRIAVARLDKPGGASDILRAS